MWARKEQWISHKMKNQHPWQLKKSKPWDPFFELPINSNANRGHIPKNWAKLAVMVADNSFYVKSIATYAPTFFGIIISVLAILL